MEIFELLKPVVPLFRFRREDKRAVFFAQLYAPAEKERKKNLVEKIEGVFAFFLAQFARTFIRSGRAGP
jgi:hypothetical protein